MVGEGKVSDLDKYHAVMKLKLSEYANQEGRMRSLLRSSGCADGSTQKAPEHKCLLLYSRMRFLVKLENLFFFYSNTANAHAVMHSKWHEIQHFFLQKDVEEEQKSFRFED